MHRKLTLQRSRTKLCKPCLGLLTVGIVADAESATAPAAHKALITLDCIPDMLLQFPNLGIDVSKICEFEHEAATGRRYTGAVAWGAS